MDIVAWSSIAPPRAQTNRSGLSTSTDLCQAECAQVPQQYGRCSVEFVMLGGDWNEQEDERLVGGLPSKFDRTEMRTAKKRTLTMQTRT